jgi:hypothetical protein
MLSLVVEPRGRSARNGQWHGFQARAVCKKVHMLDELHYKKMFSDEAFGDEGLSKIERD